MIIDMNRTMQETMRLMQAGDLCAATLAIQRGLRGAESTHTGTERAARGRRGSCIEGHYQVVPNSDSDASQTSGTAEGSEDRPGKGHDGEFRDHRFACEAGSMHYKLFIPAAVGGTAPPLIVMLHGCTQSPDDFARGTR